MILKEFEELIDREYNNEKNNKSDINEHMHDLYQLALNCTHVTEFGSRFGASTRAFLKAPVSLRAYDLEIHQPLMNLFKMARKVGKDVEYEKILKVLGQLKKENIEVSLVTKTDSSADKKTSKSNKLTKSSKIIPLPPWPTSKKISSETIEKIRKHVAKCWAMPIASSDLKTSIILKINLNEDMSVSKVDLKDKEKYFYFSIVMFLCCKLYLNQTKLLWLVHLNYQNL